MNLSKMLYLINYNIWSIKEENQNLYSLIYMEDFLLTFQDINKLKNLYEKYTEKIDLKSFYEDLQLVIYMYYIILYNFPPGTLNKIIEEIKIEDQIIKELNLKEQILLKMLLKKLTLCKLLYDNINFKVFYENSEDLNKKYINCSYKYLILIGNFNNYEDYININQNELIDYIIKKNFMINLKSLEKKYNLSNLRLHSKIHNQNFQSKINKQSKSFRIILYKSIYYENKIYNLDFFEFETPEEAIKMIEILKKNLFMTDLLFKKYLQSNNISHTFNNITVENTQIPSVLNDLLVNKNINDYVILHNRIFIIKNKRDNILNINQNIKEDLIYKIIKNYILAYINSYKLTVKDLINQYKNYLNKIKVVI